LSAFSTHPECVLSVTSYALRFIDNVIFYFNVKKNYIMIPLYFQVLRSCSASS